MLRQQAIALYQSGRWQEALHTCRETLAVAPRQPDMLALAGIISSHLGDPEAAAAYFEQAVALKRDFAEAHYNLGNALLQLGRPAAAVESFRRAAKLRPDLAAIQNNLGNALQALDRWDDAARAYRSALRRDPESAPLHRNLGIVLEASGQREEAVAAYRRAVTLKPDWSKAHSNLANLLLGRGEGEAVVEASDAWLAACPGTIEAIGLKAVALALIGDREGARYLVDLDRLVRIIRFDAAPDGYSGMPAFNAALAQHALHHPTLALPSERDPHYHCPTLRITGELLAEPKGPMAALERMMDQATRDYLADLSGSDVSHPYLLRPPRRWKLTSWAAVLDRQGNLLPHIHYDGYVSGVYYCQIPDVVGAPGQGDAGWFELGRLPDRFRPAAQPDIRTIQPREGMMILFPSYFYHRTVPFEATQVRISIAFDAHPLA
jgi:uncharacterized protein (TIGR02466 family)